MIDETAKSKRFADGLSLSSYAGSTVPEWKAQADAFNAWRDAIWIYAYAELDKVTAGERLQPSISDFIAELPPIEWPSE